MNQSEPLVTEEEIREKLKLTEEKHIFVRFGTTDIRCLIDIIDALRRQETSDE